MADKLNNAAMRAARLRAELKEKNLSAPPAPKVGFFLLGCFACPFCPTNPCADLQDPSKPKASRKRKERAAEKVAMTEKAVAKAQAEQAKRAKSVEVNSPRAEKRADQSEGAAISLHSADFQPVASPPEYTPSLYRKPTHNPEQISLALAKPFSELDNYGLDTHWTNAIDCLFSPADQDHINATSDGRETDDIFRCWVEVGPNLLCVCILLKFLHSLL